jgi:hypothetical protein
MRFHKLIKLYASHYYYKAFLYFYKYVLNDMGISFKRGKENLNT